MLIGMRRTPNPLCPMLSALVAVAFVACGSRETLTRCAPGICPAGQACDPQTGLCRAPSAPEADPAALLGPISLKARSDGRLAVTAYAPIERSLVYVEYASASAATPDQRRFVDGPAAPQPSSTAAAPATSTDAGDASSLAFDAKGTPHIAYHVRDHGALRHATRTAVGAWQIEEIDDGGDSDAGAMPALALAESGPSIAYLNATAHLLRHARRVGEAWQTETLPFPEPPADAPPGWKGAYEGCVGLALAGGKPAVVSYEATSRDLVLLSKDSGVWAATVLDGRDPTTGADDRDVGRPCAIAAAPGGALLVAYLDRDWNEMRLASVKQGVITRLRIDDGTPLVLDAGAPLQLLGGTIGLGASPAGAAIVAYTEASSARTRVAKQVPAGVFSLSLINPAGELPTLWPAVAILPDGAALFAHVRLDPRATPPAGRIVRFQLPVATPGSP